MRQGTCRIGIAFFATLVLVLQSALAVAATPVQRDIFGNVICTEGSGVKMPAGGGHDGGPDCCMLACAGSFQTATDLPPASVEWPPVVLAGAAVTLAPPGVFSPHRRRTPANPRAPPLAA